MNGNDDDSLIKKDTLKGLIGKYHKSKTVQAIEQAAKSSSVIEVGLSLLTLFPLMSEENYTDNDLKQTYDFVSSSGIDLPIFLYNYHNVPTIVNGAKRFLCAKKMGLISIKAVYVNGPLETILAYVIENLLIDKSNGLVMAYAYKMLMDRFGFKEKNIRELTNLSHGQINNFLRLNKLSPKVKKLIILGQLTSAKGRLLVPFETDVQWDLAKRFIGLSVRECEKEARKVSLDPSALKKEESFSYVKENGRIIIQSSSNRQLNIIADLLDRIKRGEK